MRQQIRLGFITLCAVALLLIFWGEELLWNLLYHHAYSFMVADYILNTRLMCGVRENHYNHYTDTAQNQTWDSLISKHISSEHSGWIIARHIAELGLCNRILDITSLFILAIATNRTLWIEWEEEPQTVLNEWEIIGMTGFDTLFNSSLRNYKRKPPEKVLQNAEEIDRACFTHHVATSPDLNADFNHKDAIVSTGYDWWGGLLLNNDHYRQTVFKGVNFSTGFPIIFKTIFNLNPPVPEPVECQWIIQYRVKRPRPKWLLRPIDDFLECAISKGMTAKEYNKTWIVTDDVETMLMHASPQSKTIISQMNLPSEKESCRGPCGDRHAMETMYKLSQCKNAVLTFGSSYGSCITSLAMIQPVYRVGRLGDCHGLPSSEPFDMNTVSKYGNSATYIYNSQKNKKS
jgi:hypothetical protein